MINNGRVGHQKLRPNFVHMAVGAGLVITIIVLQFHLMLSFDLSAMFSIIFFNLLFLFLIFPLQGTLRRKVILLIAGNQVGFLWYAIQLLFEDAVMFLNANTFRIIFLVAKPLLDFVWIVAVWSISLSMMASYKTKMEMLEKS